MERWSASPFGSAMGEKGRTLGKTYGIKVRCYWEHPWETFWEPIGNLKGIFWEQRKKKKNQGTLSAY